MTNYTELERILDTAGYATSEIKDALLEVFYLFDGRALSEENRRIVAQLLESVLEKRISEPIEGEWEPFKLGETRKGVTVRVKKDAYDAPGGQKHNGLVGYLVDIRSGRCIVQYLGRNDGVGHYHPPSSIEVLKK